MNDGNAGSLIEKKQSLKHHLWLKNRILGYPKIIKFRGSRLLF